MPAQVFRSSSNCRQTRLPDSTFMRAIASLKRVYGQEPANEAQVVRMCIELVAAQVPELSQVEVDAIGTSLYTRRKPVMITNFEYAAKAQQRAAVLAPEANARLQQALAQQKAETPVSEHIQKLSGDLLAKFKALQAADSDRQAAADADVNQEPPLVNL